MFWKTKKLAGVVDSPDSAGLLHQGRIKGLQVDSQGAYFGSTCHGLQLGTHHIPQGLASASLREQLPSVPFITKNLFKLSLFTKLRQTNL